MRTCSKILVAALLAAAAPAAAAPKEAKALRAALADYAKLKKREATLQIVVRRASAAAGEKYRLEYEALKPKLYDAANKMEVAVQQYERKHGRKALCADVGGALRPLLPQCAKATE